MSEGNVPEVRFGGFSGKWEKKDFLQVAKYKNGKAHENNISEDGKFVVINSKFVSTNGKVRKHTDIQIEPLYKNDLAFVLSDVPNGRAIAKTFIIDVDNKYSLNQRIAGISALEYIYPYFLHLLLNRNKYFLMFDDGVKQTNLSVQDIYNFVSYYPDKDEQTKIGTFFQNLDNLIAQNQKKYDKLVNMKKACLDKMFPKDGADTPEVRFIGFGGAWKNCNLKESSQSIEYGLNAAATKFDGENKYLRITDIDDELRIFLENDLSSPCIELSNADNYKLQKGDIVFARTGASVGKSYKYTETDGLVYYAGFLIRARLKPEYNPTFIFQNTLTKKYEKYIQITSQRSGQPGVNAQEYSEFSFFAASFDEQAKIGDYFQTLDNLITLQKTKLEKLKNIKKACLDKMFI